jgi:hypothetical protein
MPMKQAFSQNIYGISGKKRVFFLKPQGTLPVLFRPDRNKVLLTPGTVMPCWLSETGRSSMNSLNFWEKRKNGPALL